MRRIFLCLRIAFSAACLIAGVLLIALWVRSYSSENYVYFPLTADRMVTIHSTANRLHTPTYSLARGENSPVWRSGIILKGWGHMKFPGRQSNRSPNRMFSVGTDFNSAWIRVPYWFPLLLCVAAAAIPWLDNARLRFSLRTLFIATTLVAILLGLAVWALR